MKYRRMAELCHVSNLTLGNKHRHRGLLWWPKGVGPALTGDHARPAVWPGLAALMINAEAFQCMLDQPMGADCFFCLSPRVKNPLS
jgi:hypothetical protein